MRGREAPSLQRSTTGPEIGWGVLGALYLLLVLWGPVRRFGTGSASSYSARLVALGFVAFSVCSRPS